MGNSIKGFGFCVVLFGTTLIALAMGLVQHSRTKELKRALAEQKSKFDHEFSYVVGTTESIILDAVKIQNGKFAVTVVDEDGISMDANTLVGEKGKRFFFVARQQNCSTCLEKELLFVRDNFSEKQKAKLALLLDMPNVRDRWILSKKHGIATYHLAKDNGVLFGTHTQPMMYFAVNEHLAIHSVYVPVIFLPNLSERYLYFMSSKI